MNGLVSSVTGSKLVRDDLSPFQPTQNPRLLKRINKKENDKKGRRLGEGELDSFGVFWGTLGFTLFFEDRKKGEKKTIDKSKMDLTANRGKRK